MGPLYRFSTLLTLSKGAKVLFLGGCGRSMTTFYLLSGKELEQGCPTRGPRAACGPLGKLVRPFLLLSSLTPFFKGGKILLRRENFSMEVNFVEMSEKFRGWDRLLAGIAGKIRGSQKK